MVTQNFRSSSLHFELSYVYVTCPITFHESTITDTEENKEERENGTVCYLFCCT